MTEAPFITGSEIDSHRPDPTLGGIQANFDPNNPNPLGDIQKTFTRLDTENAGAIEAQKARAFQQQQQQRQQEHDILTRHMEHDQQLKMLQAQQALKDREDMFHMFNSTGGTAATLKDENGNDQSIPFLDQDQQKLADETNALAKTVMQDPTGFKSNPDLWRKNAEIKQMRNNASLRTVYYRQAQQQAINTFDPKEKQRLLSYADQIKNEPLTEKSLPAPPVQKSTVKPMVDASKYLKDDAKESFDDGLGVPNSEYQGLLNTTDPNQINEGFKRYEFFRQQPQGQSPEEYANYVKTLNSITDQRGLPRINLGGAITKDGKLVFDDNTYAKQQILARNYLAATELTNSGYLKEDPDKESDAADLELTKARAAKARAEAHKAVMGNKATKPTTEELKEIQHRTAAYSMAMDVNNLFEKNTKGISPLSPNLLHISNYKNILGIDVADYDIYPPIKGADADRFIGALNPETTNKKSVDGGTTETKTKPEPIKAQYIRPIINKKTGEREFLYITNNKLVDRVTEKQATVNGLKHEANYQPAQYENNVAWVEEAYKNHGSGGMSATKSPTPQPAFTPKYNGAAVQTRKGATGPEAMIGGVWKKVTGRKTNGELIVQ